MRLGDFATELYHNTDVYGLLGIIDDGQVGKGQRVSLTRDKNYHHAPGGGPGHDKVRLVFDRDELKQRHKLTPYADQRVAAGSNTDDTLTGNKARWESEEIAKGPIPLTTVKRIEVDQNTYDKMEQVMIQQQNFIDNAEKRIFMLHRGYFWHKPREKFVKIETDRQKKVHLGSEEDIKQMISRSKNHQQKYANALEMVTVTKTLGETQKIEEVEVMSSWIADLTYEDNSVMMTLNNGRQYRIHNVLPNTFKRWLKAPSKGKFWHSDIRDMFDVRRV